MRHTIPMRDSFAYFRRAWGPRAAYHLARVRYGADPNERLVSAFWLVSNRIPYSGAAPSMGFPGLPRMKPRAPRGRPWYARTILDRGKF